jgi:hypothetical protein
MRSDGERIRDAWRAGDKFLARLPWLNKVTAIDPIAVV